MKEHGGRITRRSRFVEGVLVAISTFVLTTIPVASFVLPSSSSMLGRKASSRLSLSSSMSSSVINSRRGAAVLFAKKEKEDEDLAAELARRLADDDEEPLPAIKRRPLSAPGGGGVEQKAGNRFFSVPKTQSYSKEDGTDYWMDEKTLRAEAASKKKRKPASPDQYPADKIRDEIVSPYKNNWIFFISITVFLIAFFGYLFPEEFLIPSIRIPDVEIGPGVPLRLK